MNEIKQKKIKLNEDERNSRNNKNKNDKLNNILSDINRIYQFFEYKFLPGEQPDDSNLPKWIKVSKERFDVIKVLDSMKKAILRFLQKKTDKQKQESREQPDTRDMPELESEKSAPKRRNQQGQGLKILTPDLMLSRLPITLAQLKAGNNSQKLLMNLDDLDCH